jgi:hypothetical protein
MLFTGFSVLPHHGCGDLAFGPSGSLFGDNLFSMVGLDMNGLEGLGRMRVDDCILKEHCVVSCGMLRPELEHLMEEGFIDPVRILYTPPGLHAMPERLEHHLLKRLERAREICPEERIVVIYGKNCYLDPERPDKSVDSILSGSGKDIVRVEGDYGYDMLADMEDRQRISDGRQDRILWFTAGWLNNWKLVYQNYFGWDRADANANFPGYYDRIVVLDSLGLEEEYSNHRAEDVLELFEWTGLEVVFHPIDLDRFKRLLMRADSY